MNYEKLVEKFRELARDILRMRWISNIKDQIAGIDRNIASYTKSNDEYTKDVARCNYRLSKLEQANPDFADLKKQEEDMIKDCNKAIERNNRSIADLNEDKVKVTEEIAKVTSGELKVSAENLSAKAKELAEEYMKAQAQKVSA